MSNKYAVLVTGAAGGIGNAIVKELKNNGFFVVGVDKKSSLSESGNYDIEVDLLDIVRNSNIRDEFFNNVNNILHKKKLTLKGLVNNAAVQILSRLEDIDLKDFHETIDVNLTSALILTKLFLDKLEASNGSIVNIGSIHSSLTKPEFISYATSKSALAGLTRAMAVDLGRKVRVNCLQPAATATPMLLAGFEGKEESFKELENYHPMGRIADPREVAEFVVFLLNDQAKFTTGACFDINGGIGYRLHDPE
jgi:NAD(P)-dependent dehydrogenase (short-subunit alcohol dehydrogenase family)